MSDNFAIKVENVSKSFKLPHEKHTSLKSSLIHFKRRGYEEQQVLSNIDFEIKKGEFFGIVGRNGSGKSTLLKLLAGIYTPDSGEVHVRGKLTPFIELGVGFNPELTGKENVYLNGALLGFNRKEVTAMYDQIVEFAELERFMDQKLKNYSSGMQVRLAFSIATRAETDILLIDEVLAVGDQSFQEKCFDYFSKIKKSGKTVVFVTHDMSNVERFCDRVFVIDKKSEVNGLYTIPEAVLLYNQLNHEQTSQGVVQESDQKPTNATDIKIKKVIVANASGEPCSSFEIGEQLNITVELEAKSNKSKQLPIQLGLAFYDRDGANLAGPNTKHHDFKGGKNSITYNLPAIPFTMGDYRLTVGLYSKDGSKQYDYLDKEISFFVNSSESHHGKFILDGEWQ